MQKSRATKEGWPENLRTSGAAEFLGISVSKITKLRMAANRQYSPPFVKAAGCVIYRRKDLDDWLERHVVRSDYDDAHGSPGQSGAAVLPLKPPAPRARTRRVQPRRTEK